MVASEQEYLGNTAALLPGYTAGGMVPLDQCLKVPGDELAATRAEAEAELQLTLALIAQQDGDRELAQRHTAAASDLYAALRLWDTARSEPPC